MSRKTSSPIIVVLVLLMVACSGQTGITPTVEPSPIPTHTEPPVIEEPGHNLLIEAEGDIQLKRDDWSDYHPTDFGASLQRGDQLRPADGSKAVVLCDDLVIWTVPAGVPSGLTNGCTYQPDPPLVRNGSQLGNVRGPTDNLIPYIISPRATQLLTFTPTLRWNSVPGTTSYNVRVRGGDVDWSTEVEGTEIEYPGDPPLEPDVWYLLIIEADNDKSSQDEGKAGDQALPDL